MRHCFHIAAAMLLLRGAAMLRAQIVSPDILVAPAPRNPATRHQTLSQNPNDLQWLWPFTRPAPNGRAYDLRVDARFQSLLAANFQQPQAMWGTDAHRLPLAQVIPLFVSQYGDVAAESNRYITLDGCVPSFCPAHGLLWVDTGSPHPLMVFAAVNWTEENHTTDEAAADYSLWLFPNHTLEPDALPLALTEAIAHWDARLAAAHRLVPHIAHAILVQPGGQPAALDPALIGSNTLPPQPDTLTPTDSIVQ